MYKKISVRDFQGYSIPIVSRLLIGTLSILVYKLLNFIESLQDINDNAPIITGGKEFTIKEKQPAGGYVGTVTAEDRDEGMNAQIVFHLNDREFPSAKMFRIAASGELSTITEFDRESQAEHKLLVYAVDQGLRVFII